MPYISNCLLYNVPAARKQKWNHRAVSRQKDQKMAVTYKTITYGGLTGAVGQVQVSVNQCGTFSADSGSHGSDYPNLYQLTEVAST